MSDSPPAPKKTRLSAGFVLPPSLVDCLTDDPKTWSSAPGLVSVAQVSPSGLELLFRTAQEMRTAVRQSGGDDRLAGKTLATVFYEASTRTACSFQAAVARLGGRYVHYAGLDKGAEGGGDLTEAVQEIASGTCADGGDACDGGSGDEANSHVNVKAKAADAVVLRHPIKGSVGAVLQSSGVRPIINAGDGTGEHPTQALLDLFTIWDELKLQSTQSQRKRLVVVLLGDLKHGRTVHSLAKLLARSGLNVPITLRYAAPPLLAMPKAVREVVEQHDNVTQETYDTLDKTVLEGADVLYVTRVQRERFDDPADYEQVKGSYIVNRELMKDAPSSTIVMHPLPRVEEISTDFDDDPRAAYFRQMENGMYVRMAILSLLMANDE